MTSGPSGRLRGSLFAVLLIVSGSTAYMACEPDSDGIGAAVDSGEDTGTGPNDSGPEDAAEDVVEDVGTDAPTSGAV